MYNYTEVNMVKKTNTFCLDTKVVEKYLKSSKDQKDKCNLGEFCKVMGMMLPEGVLCNTKGVSNIDQLKCIMRAMRNSVMVLHKFKKKIGIQNFGNISIETRKQKEFTNLKRERCTVPSKNYIKFQPAQYVKDVLNDITMFESLLNDNEN